MARRILLTPLIVLLIVVAVAFAQEERPGAGDGPSDAPGDTIDVATIDASAPDAIIDESVVDESLDGNDQQADSSASPDAPLTPAPASPLPRDQKELAVPLMTPTPTPTPLTASPTISTPISVASPLVTEEPPATITPSPTHTPTAAVRATATATPSPSRTHTSTPTPGPFNFLSGGGVPFGLPTSAIPSGQGPASGLWTGMTSQGKTISFTVDGSNIRTMSFGWTTTGCSATDAQTNDTYPAGGPQITANTLMIMGAPPNGLQGIVYISGTFTTASAAAGSGSVALFGTAEPPCGSSTQFTWSASPSGHP